MAGGLQVLRANLDAVTLDGCVSARIRWYKELRDLDIAVQATGGKTVVLKGTVPTLDKRQRAVQLANTTVGVESVQDELQVKP